ncbi:MAG: hypothetical protein Q8K82_00960 [Gemmatimonadaceae bacterium]|nr:hypothetical protein [Gemmatimonadaceae bacterium]
MSYRLAYWVVWIVTAIAAFAVMVALAERTSTWVWYGVPVAAFILFPRERVAERIATKDRDEAARWDPPAPESPG